MKTSIFLLLMCALVLSCVNRNPGETSSESDSPIYGTWQLLTVETIEGGEVSIDKYTEGIKGIKMFNESHFSFFQHDLSQGKDSMAVFVSGGGTYTLVDGIYTENLEYCNFREYEDNSFTFEVVVQGDTLLLRGEEVVEEAGVNKYIIETYVRVE